MNVQELREKRAQAVAAARAILDTADKAGRSALSADDEKRYKEHVAEAESMEARIKQEETLGTMEADLERVPESRIGREDTHTGPGTHTGPLRLGIDKNGNEIRGYKHGDRMGSSACADESRATLGSAVKKLTGAASAEELRALQGGSDTAGGYLLSSPVSAHFIDLARNQLVIGQAGAITIPITGDSLTVARLTGDPTASWRSENVALDPSDPTFDAVVLTPKTVGALVKVSLELSQDATNIGGIVENALSQALALEIDRVALRGDGAAAEPLGILNTTGINTIAVGGAPDYDDFSNAVQDVAENNGTATAAILAPRDWGTLDRLKGGDGHSLIPPVSWNGLSKFVSNQVPATLGGGTDSEAYCGDFTQLWIGMRSDILIEASREAADSTNSAFTSLQVWIRAFARVDIAVMRPTHFVSLTGITA